MKNTYKSFLYPFCLGILGFACEGMEDELIGETIERNTTEIEYTSGDADFTNYVALGGSFTAGFMDAALYNEGQMSTYPKLVGQQLMAAGLATAFNQPDINAPNGFNIAMPGNNPADPMFGRFILDISVPGPVPVSPGDPFTAFAGNKAALNNFGVPGATLASLSSPALAANPFYARFATNPGASTVVGDALATDPSFFTLWSGSDEILSYAQGGGVGESTLALYPQADFTAAYANIIGQFVQAGAKGVVINIPPVLLTPYFRAVPWNPIPLSEAQAQALNAGFAGFNAALNAIVANLGHAAADADKREVSYSSTAPNPLLIMDETLESLATKFDILQQVGAITAAQRAALEPYVQARPATAQDLVPLATRLSIGQDLNPAAPGTALLGISVPMGDQYILIPQEQAAIVTAEATYNAVIAGIANATPAVEMFDVQPLFANLAGLSAAQAAMLALTPAAQQAADGVLGIVYEGVRIAPDFSPSGFFSTDGIHPNPRGHAIIANELISFINSSYGSTIPGLNTTIYRTVLFQQ
jgi:phospholipase/lecithinase/hemolysin